MKQYISKADVVTELKMRIKINKECMLGLRNLDYYQGKVDALNDTISLLDTLEVKEVDLEKEIDSTYRNYVAFGRQEIATVAKHFFELGMALNNKE